MPICRISSIRPVSRSLTKQAAWKYRWQPDADDRVHPPYNIQNKPKLSRFDTGDIVLILWLSGILILSDLDDGRLLCTQKAHHPQGPSGRESDCTGLFRQCSQGRSMDRKIRVMEIAGLATPALFTPLYGAHPFGRPCRYG